MPLYLVRFEHEDGDITCCLVRAGLKDRAYEKVDRWLSQDCRKIDTDMYLDLEDNDILKIEGISEIDSVEDLEKYLPLIDGLSAHCESVISNRNN